MSQSSVDQTLSVLQGDLPPQLLHSDVAVRKLLMEGVAYRYAQQFEKAQKRVEEANQLAATAAPQLLCEITRAQGEIEVDLKKYAEAEADFQQSLKLADRHQRPDQKAAALVDLARLATSEDRFDEAIDRSQRALEFSRELDMQGLVATALGNTGWNYFQLGDFDSALSFFQQAANASEKIGLTGYSFYWRTGVANSYVALHDPAPAVKLLEDTLARAKEINDSATVTECLNDLTEIDLKQGRLPDAELHNSEALRIEEEGRDHFGIVQSRLHAARIRSESGDFADAGRILTDLIGDPEADSQSVWQAKAELAEVHDGEGHRALAAAEYKSSIRDIDRVYDSIQSDELRLSFLSGAIELYDSYIDFLVRAKRVREALNVAELSRARTLQRGLALRLSERESPPDELEPHALAHRKNAALLLYWLGQKHSYLWAITPTKVELFTLPPGSEIEARVKAYRKAQADGADVLRSATADGEELYKALVAPAANMIPRGSRVVVLPDASLYSLNFETLIVPEPQPHFWIEDATVSVANSLTLLSAASARLNPRHSALDEKALLLVGDTLQASPDFPLLRQAPQEIALVEKHFPETPRLVLAKQQATPSKYLASHPEEYAYLHFVTHGIASRTRPLESAVILSPDGDSYKLYAREIVKHRLNAELVTISACNGSGTRAYSGEGLVGLSWAFLRAGAHNVIGALWEVSDTATPQLMDRLYAGIAAAQDPATALRNAKLEFVHSGNVYAKPFYWAAFQLYSGS